MDKFPDILKKGRASYNTHMSDKFSKYLTGFCKNDNTALLNMAKTGKVI